MQGSWWVIANTTAPMALKIQRCGVVILIDISNILAGGVDWLSTGHHII